MFFGNKKAFTLSEVLMVLMIIGVIAAMTIPTLYTNINESRRLNALKKIYSAFSISVQTVLNKSNVSSLADLRAWGTDYKYKPTENMFDTVASSRDALADAAGAVGEGKDDLEAGGSISTGLSGGSEESPEIDTDKKQEGEHNGVLAQPEYIHVQSECPRCFVNRPVLPGMTMAEDGTAQNFSVYMLRDGSYFAIQDYEGNCTHTLPTVKNGNEPIYLCGVVIFDVNGKAAPNTPGEDLFAFYLVDEILKTYISGREETPSPSYLLPIGYSNETSEENTTATVFNPKNVVTSMLFGSAEVMGYNDTATILRNNWHYKRYFGAVESKDENGRVVSRLEPKKEGGYIEKTNVFNDDGTYVQTHNDYDANGVLLSKTDLNMTGDSVLNSRQEVYDKDGEIVEVICKDAQGQVVTCEQ